MSDQDYIELWLDEQPLPDVDGDRLAAIIRMARTTADTRLAMARARAEDSRYTTWADAIEMIRYLMAQVYHRLEPEVGEDAIRSIDHTMVSYLRHRIPPGVYDL